MSGIQRLRSWTLYALIVFLPLSAWLVSFTGNYQVALIRDFLVAFLFVLTLLEIRSFKLSSAESVVALIFILSVLLSYFHREANFDQWLRGVRYLVEPLILFLLIQGTKQEDESRPLFWLYWISMIVGVVGLFELLNPALTQLSLSSGSRGYLDTIHRAQEFLRLQSTLAGPNALGLFLMVVLLLSPAWYHRLRPVMVVPAVAILSIVFLLTFSRSSYLGLLVGGVALLVASHQTVERYSRSFILGFAAIIVIIGGLFLVRPQELTRYNSNTLRLEQYQRVWHERGEIGFWGRGAGAAGLVSQYRLDDGSSRYTENTYLDAYESVGVIGALSYLLFWILLIIRLWKNPSILSRTTGAASVALLIAGLFITHYTGQAGLWIVMIFAGLALADTSAMRVTRTSRQPIWLRWRS